MTIVQNGLRMYRKSSPLSQADIAFLMQLPDYSSISRWEQGHRVPNIDALLIYHLLFDTPIEKLLTLQKGAANKVLIERIHLLLAELRNHKLSRKVTSRIIFLESALTKLTV